jgi:hypothetical protein
MLLAVMHLIRLIVCQQIAKTVKLVLSLVGTAAIALSQTAIIYVINL